MSGSGLYNVLPHLLKRANSSLTNEFLCSFFFHIKIPEISLRMLQILFLALTLSYAASSVPTNTSYSYCKGRKAGKYCASSSTVLICNSVGFAATEGCNWTGPKNIVVYGRCVDTHDGNAYCQGPAPSTYPDW